MELELHTSFPAEPPVLPSGQLTYIKSHVFLTVFLTFLFLQAGSSEACENDERSNFKSY